MYYNVTIYFAGMKIELYNLQDRKLYQLKDWSEGMYNSIHKFSHEGFDYILRRDELIGISYRKV